MTQHQHLHLRIISATKVEYENNVAMVLLPGEDGEFGVLPHHMEMIAALKDGTIKIYHNEKIDDLTIKGGVASIYKDSKLDVMII